MTKVASRSLLFLLIAAAILAVALLLRPLAAENMTISEIAEKTHFHGIAVDPRDASRVYLATHHGFFVVGPDGMAKRVSENADDFMGFTPHPTDPSILYASGHPASGGNLGIIMSTDGGRNWSRIARGVNGPVDFHQMDASKADPKVIYGVHGDLQVSRDGGHSWQRGGTAPDGLIDLAASAKDVNRLYAATKGGLFASEDGGKSWRIADILTRPTTMVQTGLDGRIYAFVVGTGLLRTTEPSLDWSVVSNDFGDNYILHLAIDPTDNRNLYAVTLEAQTRKQAILVSRDAGQTWSILGD